MIQRLSGLLLSLPFIAGCCCCWGGTAPDEGIDPLVFDEIEIEGVDADPTVDGTADSDADGADDGTADTATDAEGADEGTVPEVLDGAGFDESATDGKEPPLP